jgi:hypothetical protein
LERTGEDVERKKQDIEMYKNLAEKEKKML